MTGVFYSDFLRLKVVHLYEVKVKVIEIVIDNNCSVSDTVTWLLLRE